MAKFSNAFLSNDQTKLTKQEEVFNCSINSDEIKIFISDNFSRLVTSCYRCATVVSNSCTRLWFLLPCSPCILALPPRNNVWRRSYQCRWNSLMYPIFLFNIVAKHSRQPNNIQISKTNSSTNIRIKDRNFFLTS